MAGDRETLRDWHRLFGRRAGGVSPLSPPFLRG